MQIFDYLSNATVVFFIANSLYVISYMLTSMIWLRVLAVIAAVSTFPYFYFQPEPLWSAIFWQGCFLTVNLVNLLFLFYSMRSASFDEEEQLAYEMKFSSLKPYEARPIFKSAECITVKAGQVLLFENERNDSLFLILKGECKILKNEKEVARLHQGNFAGELSFLSDDPVSANVVAARDTLMMRWNKRELDPLFQRQGLYESYFQAMCSQDMAGKLRNMTAANAAV